MGTIYKRGKIYWIKYHHSGKAFYESTKSTKWADAANLLKLREGDAASGKPAGVRFDKVMFEDLVQDFIEDYRLKGQKMPRVWDLEKFFDGYRAIDVTTAEIKRYITHRKKQDSVNATINRELAALKRMFNLAAKQTPPKVSAVPYIPMQKEDNVKEGFFEDEDYHALLKQLPEYISHFVQFAYWTDWREAQIRNMENG